MSKKTKLIIMGAALLVMIGAVIGVTIYQSNVEANTPEEESSAIVSDVLFDIGSSSNIASMEITCGDDTFTLVQNGVSDTGSIIWIMKEHPDWDLYYPYSYVLSMGTKFSAYKHIEDDVTDSSRLDEFGLKNPVASFVVTTNDGETYEIRIGNLSSDRSYAFCQLVGDNTVYACDKSYYTYSTYTSGGLRQATIRNTVNKDNGELIYLYTQKHGERAVEIEQDDEAVANYTVQGATYIGTALKFTQPYSNDALMVDVSLKEKYLSNLVDLEIAAIIDPNCEDLDQYGLGEETFQYREIITTRVAGANGEYEYNTTDYVFGYPYADGSALYFREGNSNYVFAVDIACMEGRKFTPFEFVNQLMFYEIITNVESAELTIKGETHSLTKLMEEVAEDADETQAVATAYYVDGKLVSTDLFTELYRAMISVAPDYEIVGAEPVMDNSDVIEFTLHLTNGEDKTVTYVRTSEFYYVCQTANDLWFAASDTDLEAVEDALQACLDYTD